MNPLGIQVARLLPHEAEVERRLQVPVDVIAWDEVLQRDADGFIEAGLGRAEH